MHHVVQRLVLVSWLLTSTGFLFAQTSAPDALHRLDRTTQNVRVKEITDAEVFYTDLNAPAMVRKIRKAELWKVVFGDGTADIYNEPPPNKPVPNSPVPLSAPTSATNRPVTSKSEPKPIVERSRPVLSGTELPGMFLSGQKALSFGPSLAGSSTTNKNSKTSTTATGTAVSLSVLYQQFKRDNVSIGGGLTIGTSSSKSTADITTSTPFVALSGLTRRYLPVADNVAFYGYGSAELALQWQKATYLGQSETGTTQQQLSVEIGAGLAYLFNSRWSIDFNTSLLGLTIDRSKDKSPTSKAFVDLALTGAGVTSSFSLFLTRYF